MISATLWNSGLFFAALLCFSTVVLRIAPGAMVVSGVAILLALVSSSLAVSLPVSGLTGHSVAGPVLRFLPFLVVLVAFNRAGDARTALAQTLWLWAQLDLIFVATLQQVPDPGNYLDAHMPVYLAAPAAIALLLRFFPLPASWR